MKKPFKKTVAGKILVGIGDAFTGGTVSNLVYTDEEKPTGAIDWHRAGISISTVILIISFVTGKITFQDLENVLKIITP